MIGILLWAATGPMFRYSDTWQLVVNTATTVIAFLMVFLIPNTQTRDAEAMHIKIDELIRAIEDAHNALHDLEELGERDLEKIRTEYIHAARERGPPGARGGGDRDRPIGGIGYDRHVIVHLLDGTYELFRAFYGAPESRASDGREVGATRTLLRSFAALLREPDVTHVAVAFDTVIESFRNRLFAGYKTGAGIDRALHSQFELAERATRALGMVTWSMLEHEADDALASFAARAAADARVEQVRICSPDKDLCQCVRGEHVVLYDRKKRIALGDAGVRERLGVVPERVPAWLALVGDTADGIPGIPRWGERGAARVLERYASVAEIPSDAAHWEIDVRGAKALAAELAAQRDAALLYEQLATLRLDVPLPESVDDLRYRGPRRAELEALCAEIGAPDVPGRSKPDSG